MLSYERFWFVGYFCIGHGQPNPREGEIFLLRAQPYPSVGNTNRMGVEYKDLNDKADTGLQLGLCPGILS